MESDFAEARSAFKEVEKVFDGEIAHQCVTQCERREVDHVPPRQRRSNALQTQLAQRREVSVEESGCNRGTTLWRTPTIDLNGQGSKKRCGTG